MTGGQWPTGVLPEWAEQLAQSCSQYRFSSQQVHEGRSVVATRAADGPGPLLVITRSEEEMRAALGLRPRPARKSPP